MAALDPFDNASQRIREQQFRGIQCNVGETLDAYTDLIDGIDLLSASERVQQRIYDTLYRHRNDISADNVAFKTALLVCARSAASVTSLPCFQIPNPAMPEHEFSCICAFLEARSGGRDPRLREVIDNRLREILGEQYSAANNPAFAGQYIRDMADIQIIRARPGEEEPWKNMRRRLDLTQLDERLSALEAAGNTSDTAGKMHALSDLLKEIDSSSIPDQMKQRAYNVMFKCGAHIAPADIILKKAMLAFAPNASPVLMLADEGIDPSGTPSLIGCAWVTALMDAYTEGRDPRIQEKIDRQLARMLGITAEATRDHSGIIQDIRELAMQVPWILHEEGDDWRRLLHNINELALHQIEKSLLGPMSADDIAAILEKLQAAASTVNDNSDNIRQRISNVISRLRSHLPEIDVDLRNTMIAFAADPDSALSIALDEMQDQSTSELKRISWIIAILEIHLEGNQALRQSARQMLNQFVIAEDGGHMASNDIIRALLAMVEEKMKTEPSALSGGPALVDKTHAWVQLHQRLVRLDADFIA